LALWSQLIDSALSSHIFATYLFTHLANIYWLDVLEELIGQKFGGIIYLKSQKPTGKEFIPRAEKIKSQSDSSGH
jgi:hypothetical protein